jgi:hypothetical protein
MKSRGSLIGRAAARDQARLVRDVLAAPALAVGHRGRLTPVDSEAAGAFERFEVQSAGRIVLHMTKTFKVGDTVACRINGEPQRVTWRDEDILVIEPDDARVILTRTIDRDLICFMCGDQSLAASEYTIEIVPGTAGFVVNRRS